MGKKPKANPTTTTKNGASPPSSPTSAIKKSTINKIQIIKKRTRGGDRYENPVLKLSVLKNTAINSFTSDVTPTEEQILERMKVLKNREERQTKMAKLHKLQMMFGLLGDEDEEDFEDDEEGDEDEEYVPRPSASDLLDQFANDEDDDDEDDFEDYDPMAEEVDSDDDVIRE